MSDMLSGWLSGWHKTTGRIAAGVLLALVCAFVCLGPGGDADAASTVRPVKKAKAPEPAAFTNSDQVLKWVFGYRLKPEPKRLPKAVQALIASGLVKDIDQSGVYVGFIAGVLGTNPELADQLVSEMFPMQPEDQVILIKAIAFSGLADWKGLLARFSERMPARGVLIGKYLFGKGETLAELKLESSPFAIDANWGFYFATSDTAPIARIVKAVAFSKDKDDVEKLTIGNMAKWTLAQNATRDVDLMNFLKRDLGEEPPEIAGPLREVIDAAETFELSKIRKEATASIEELRQKGPETTRRFAWWGQAGQTALALGCVVAGALGQVEVGIPCVVGGALSTAALKYLSPATP